MKRRRVENTLIVASHNAGKVREIADLIRPFNISVKSAEELKLIEPEETESTFEGNAIIKARAAAMSARMTAISDDSGLCVHALDNDPGIYSARWAGPDKDFYKAMEKIENKLNEIGAADRTAHFSCVIAVAWPDGEVLAFEGRVDGTLTWPPRGNLGFGYDPMFIPNGYAITFGEMEPALKHKISHRAQAFKKFVNACFR